MVWDVSYTVSLPIGAWLFNSGSYVCVFGVSLLLFIIASLLAVLRLWGFKEKINSEDLTLRGPPIILTLMGMGPFGPMGFPRALVS